MPTPAFDQITVVVQGPVMTQTSRLAPQGITHQVLKQLRLHLPGSRIVLSTWADSPVEGLDADEIVLSKDPGTTRFYPPDAKPANPFNNGNRLIVSTQQGLACVKTPYVLKIRSDLALHGNRFLRFMDRYQAYDPKWKVLKQRILAYPIYSLKYEMQGDQVGYRPFHISDWAYFGLTEDVQLLFACDLMPEPETSQWFATHPRIHPTLWPERWWRYSPEQYLTSDLARRTCGVVLKDGDQNDRAIREQSERFIGNNFCVLDQWDWQMWSLKLLNTQMTLPDMIYTGLYRHEVWLNDYVLYANGTRSRQPSAAVTRSLRRLLVNQAPQPVEEHWEGSLHILNRQVPLTTTLKTLRQHWRKASK